LHGAHGNSFPNITQTVRCFPAGPGAARPGFGRVLFGIRRQFYLGDGRSAFTAEASWGVSGRKRFGRFLNYRQEEGPGLFPFFDPRSGGSGNSQTVHFDVGVFTLPLSLKIGYSWGG
jgi:hypothetical protein